MTNTNALTGAVIDYIRMQYCHAERVNNVSRQVKSKFGAMVHIPSANFKGTADIHACKKVDIKIIGESFKGGMKVGLGQFVAIEVKQKDKQSEAQAYYQSCVERAGGVYMIVRTFDDFLKQWNEI
jgi:phosphoenolpyruvate-protein kinase (PTS system EI component)